MSRPNPLLKDQRSYRIRSEQSVLNKDAKACGCNTQLCLTSRLGAHTTRPNTLQVTAWNAYSTSVKITDVFNCLLEMKYTGQGSINFPKTCRPPPNARSQTDDTKQIPYEGIPHTAVTFEHLCYLKLSARYLGSKRIFLRELNAEKIRCRRTKFTCMHQRDQALGIWAP